MNVPLPLGGEGEAVLLHNEWVRGMHSRRKPLTRSPLCTAAAALSHKALKHKNSPPPATPHALGGDPPPASALPCSLASLH